MSKMNSITENRYTLNDIFVKNREAWLAVPLFCYLITPIIHMIVFAINFSPKTQDEAQIAHMLATGEWMGDYYKSIINAFCWLALLFALIAFRANRTYEKQNGIERSADSVPMYFFLALCVLIILSTIINHTESPLLFGYTVRGEGIFFLLLYFLVFYRCGSKIKGEKVKYAIIYFFLITSSVIGVLSLIDFFVVKIKIFSAASFTAIFYHFNFYAYYLTIAIMLSAALFALEKNKAARIFAFFSLCLNSVVLAFNNSFGGFLACLVAFVFLIVAASIKKGGFSFSALATLLVFLAICFAVGLKYESFFSEIIKFGGDVEKIATNAEDADSAGTWRWGLWRKTCEYIKERPFIGYGIEGTVERLAADTGQEKVHNEYLDYAVEFGIPAALLYIGGLMSIFIKALIKRKSVDNVTLVCLTASLGYIGSAFFGNRMIFILPFFFIFLGLANSTEPSYEKLALQKEAEAKAAEEAKKAEIKVETAEQPNLSKQTETPAPAVETAADAEEEVHNV